MVLDLNIWIPRVIIIVIVLATILILMVEGIDATKITVTGSIFAILIFRYFMNWEDLSGGSEGHEVHFTEAIAGMVNYEAIIIIFSVSIIVALTKGAGFFDFISLYIVKLTKGNPKLLMLSLGGLTFFVSMFFDNLSAIILLGSLTAIICKQMELRMTPYVLFVGMNTIIGGLPTPVSSLPNIIFVSYYPGEITFIKFMLYMLPAALFFFFLAAGFFFLVFRKDIFVKISDEKKEQISHINPWSGIEDRRNIAKSVILLIVLFVGFLLSNVMGIGVDIVALIAAVFGIFLFRTDLKKYLEEGVEWAMIVFFTALFVLMGVLSASGALDPISDMLAGVLGSSNSKVTGEIFVALIIGAVGLPITGFLNGSSAALVFSHIF